MTRRQKRANLVGLSVGLCATGVALLLHALGATERLEQITLDLRFRYVNAIEKDPRIVCVDIDDKSIDDFGRWPWTRTRQAALVALPAECGALATVVDLIWSEGETLGVRAAPHLDVLSDPLHTPGGDFDFTFPDHELRRAVARSGNVYISYAYKQRDLLSADEFRSAVDALLRSDESGADQSLAELFQQRRSDASRYAVAPRPEEEDRPIDRARLVAAMVRNPLLEDAEAGSSVRVDGAFAARVAQRCRDAAYARIVADWLHAADRARRPPHELYAELRGELLRDRAAPTFGIDAFLAPALRKALGERGTLRRAPADELRPLAVRVEGVDPAYFLLADAARGAGFVNFDPDSDGVVRRVPVLCAYRGRVLPQIALAVAHDLLGLRSRPAPGGGAVDLVSDDPQIPRRRMQLDRRNELLIPWPSDRVWTSCFEHVSAGFLVRLLETREEIDHACRQMAALLGTLAGSEGFDALRDEAESLAGFGEALDALRAAELSGERDVAMVLREQLAALRAQLDVLAQRAQEVPGTGLSDASAELLGELRRARGALEQMRRNERDATSTLRGRFEGRYVFVGYTATSLADLKPIPTNRSAPGVLAHASLFNGLLTNQLMSSASAAFNLLLACIAGATLSAVSVFLRPRLSLLVLILALVAFITLAGVVPFWRWRYVVELTPAVAAMFLAWSAVSAYRYVFIEGERRQLSTALGQYTSPEIARQVAENAELCRRAEMREVTAMFTDLRGFTTISERIGAERTQRVLNVCLGRFTDALLLHEAMINKFIGDGIFAFWNPVIYPQADHARRACEAAVDLIRGLEMLRDEQARGGGDEVFADLLLRIGVATGNAVVGPCGSEQKFDYTCIGDSVNVAARLESANKFYGTNILVSAATREQGGEGFAFRPLGGVQVKGKQQAVQVFELIGRRDAVDATTLEYARDFGLAVDLFQSRRFADAVGAFDALSRRRPDDPAARHYRDASALLAAHVPGDDWNGAIELTEK